MANLPNFSYQFTILILFSSYTILLATAKDHDFMKTMDKKLFGLKREKLSHFRLYWHDVLTGPHPSAVQVVPPPKNTSRLAFGLIRMIDNALTLEPRLNSTLVGRAQGFYAQASQQEIGLLMAMNFAFMEGKYNGSTITVLGRNVVFSEVREMPVIGGSGLFRFARGYVQARTHTSDANTGNAIVEYNIYVLHY